MTRHDAGKLVRGPRWILVLMAATWAIPAEAAPHAGTAWIAMPGFHATGGDPAAADRPGQAVPRTESVRGRGASGDLSITVDVPRGRFGLLSGQILMIKRPGSRAGGVAEVRVGVSGNEARLAAAGDVGVGPGVRGVPWHLSAEREAGDQPIELFRFPTQPKGADEAGERKPLERVPVSIASRNGQALWGQYDFVLTHVWDAIDPDGCAPIVPTDGDDPESLLDTGIYRLFAGEWDAAAEAFGRLAASDDPAIAAIGRQCLRRLQAARWIAEAAQNADAAFAYDAALCAWANGFYDLARDGFRRASELAPTDPLALYHLAETEERAGADVFTVAEILDRAGCLAGATPNAWDVLVTILMGETTPDGKLVRMTEENVERIVEEWQVVEKMIHGASLGHYRLNTTFRVIPDTNAVPYVLNAGWLYGPDDEAVPVAGTYDSCMSFRPAGPSVAGGADCGPNGAAMTDIGTWCGWEVYLHEWNHQFDWGMITSEIGVGYPATHDSDGCGPQPIPSMGAGHRGSMRYYVTPAMYRRVELADVPTAPAIRSWEIAGPFPLTVADGEAQPRLLDVSWTDAEEDLVAGGAGGPGMAWATWHSDGDFVDMNETLRVGDAANVGAYARAFVYAPESREIRLWLGHNDGMRVWVNGARVHGGRYFSIAKWDDRNRPDSVVSWARLEPGWNRILCKIQKWDGDWGFSVRPCGFDGSSLEGVRFSAEAQLPAAVASGVATRGRYYRWEEVSGDFTSALPRWDESDLREYTGMAGLELRGGPQATRGAVALVVGEGVEPLPGSRFGSEPAAEDDAQLNNVMSWGTEGIAALRFEHEGNPRDLLLVRAESVEPVMRLLREEGVPPDAPDRVDARILGYLLTSEGTSPRALLIAEAWLGDWPKEEEGLFGAAP